MKKLLLASTAAALFAGTASAEDVKIGILLGFTGPIETMAPAMGMGADLAIAEANASGMASNTFAGVRADTTCVDAAAATAAAERLITSEGVKGIVGADCSGVTAAVLANVARPNGMVMISPSATGPTLGDEPDDGFFFRSVSSDAREAQVMAAILKERGVNSIAITYSNSDFGKGQAELIQSEFEKVGGNVTISASHDDGKSDYSAEVAALATAGGDILVVAGYADQGGKGIVQAALDTGAFATFGLPNGMVSDALPVTFGDQLDGSYGQAPASNTDGAEIYIEMAKAAPTPFDGTGIFSGNTYDATALIMLAMEAAGSTDPKVYKDKIIEIANGPADGSGEIINPGELGKAFELIKAGKAINYEGATGINMLENGDSQGSYREVEIKGGKIENVKFH